MIYHIEVSVGAPTQQKQTSWVNFVRSYMAQFEADLYPDGTKATACANPFNAAYKWGPDWQFGVGFGARFHTQANRDGLWNQLDAQLGTGNQGPNQGSTRAGYARRYDIGVDQDPIDYTIQNFLERVW